MHWLELDGKVMQLRAYNDFIWRFSSMFSFGAFFDIDEFLVVRGKSLEQALHERKHLPQFAPNWRLMGSNGLHKGEEMSVLKRFTRGEAKLNKHVKQFINFKLFSTLMMPMPTFINPHCTAGCSYSMSGKLFYGPWQEEDLSQRQDMELFHFAVKTPEELHEKVMRGRADTTLTREAEEQSYFKEHDKNEVEFLDALSLMC